MSAAAERPFSALTLAELREKAAALAARAEKLRARQAVVVPTTPTAGAIARDVRRTAQQALEYALLLTMAERHNDDLKDRKQ